MSITLTHAIEPAGNFQFSYLTHANLMLSAITNRASEGTNNWKAEEAFPHYEMGTEMFGHGENLELEGSMSSVYRSPVSCKSKLSLNWVVIWLVNFSGLNISERLALLLASLSETAQTRSYEISLMHTAKCPTSVRIGPITFHSV